MWYSAVGGIVTLILSLLMTPHAADAQQRGKVPRIGFLSDSPLRPAVSALESASSMGRTDHADKNC